MSWYINNDFINDQKGNLICILFPEIDPFYSRLIKKTPDVFDLIMEFFSVYEAHKKMTKGLFDRFNAMIDISEDYNFKWRIDKNGDIVDGENGKICFFTEKDSIDATIIQYTPEMFSAVKEIVLNFNSTNAKQKPVYEKFCALIEKINDR